MSVDKFGRYLEQNSSGKNRTKFSELHDEAENEAATKCYVDAELNSVKSIALLQTKDSGSIVYDAGLKRIIQVASPKHNYNAANKKYVDDNIDKIKSLKDTLIETNKRNINLLINEKKSFIQLYREHVLDLNMQKEKLDSIISVTPEMVEIICHKIISEEFSKILNEQSASSKRTA